MDDLIQSPVQKLAAYQVWEDGPRLLRADSITLTTLLRTQDYMWIEFWRKDDVASFFAGPPFFAGPLCLATPLRGRREISSSSSWSDSMSNVSSIPTVSRPPAAPISSVGFHAPNSAEIGP